MGQRDPFRCLADPVFATAIWLYLANRWFFKPYGIGGDFARDYLNDLLCLPLCLPMILYAQRRIGLRPDDGAPRAWEVIQHWFVFSIVFEVVVPAFPEHFRSTSDPFDVIAYFCGGAISLMIWRGHLSISQASARHAKSSARPARRILARSLCDRSLRPYNARFPIARAVRQWVGHSCPTIVTTARRYGVDAGASIPTQRPRD